MVEIIRKLSPGRPILDRFVLGKDFFWSGAALLTALLVALPIFAIVVAAVQEFDGALWRHLLQTVLPRYLWNSAALAIGTCGLALLFGVGTAWLVVRYRFFGSLWFQWMLLLPLAIPSYIVAYCYTDFFEYGGVAQNFLRELWPYLFGRQVADDYVFFEIRSLGGAIMVMGFGLYPYIYLLVRTAFRATPESLYEVAILHNRSLFWSVALPIARPALIGGLALVAMESLADFGTVEFFAVETVTLGIFNLWLGMNSLSAAVQLSLLAFLLVFALLAVEVYYRRGRLFSAARRESSSVSSVRRLYGWRSAMACFICCVPLFFGFIFPFALLAGFAFENFYLTDFGRLFSVIWNSVWVATVASLLICVVALFLVLVSLYRGGRWVRLSVYAATGGYAFPGVILAIGVLLSVGYVNNFIGGGLWVSGVAVLWLGYIVRFNAVGFAAMSDGVLKLPVNWLSASLVLGRGFFESLWRLGLPLLRNSILVGFLLCFVDVVKELPMALLLRPFNFDTLATVIYEYAHSELLELVGLPALFIVGLGLVAVIVVHVLMSDK